MAKKTLLLAKRIIVDDTFIIRNLEELTSSNITVNLTVKINEYTYIPLSKGLKLYLTRSGLFSEDKVSLVKDINVNINFLTTTPVLENIASTYTTCIIEVDEDFGIENEEDDDSKKVSVSGKTLGEELIKVNLYEEYDTDVDVLKIEIADYINHFDRLISTLKETLYKEYYEKKLSTKEYENKIKSIDRYKELAITTLEEASIWATKALTV